MVLQYPTLKGGATSDGLLTGSGFKTPTGNGSGFLKDDGTVDTSNYLLTYSETDTLHSVVSRNNSTSLEINSTSLITVGSGTQKTLFYPQFFYQYSALNKYFLMNSNSSTLENKNSSSFNTELQFPVATGNWIYLLPQKSGTLATLDDLGSYALVGHNHDADYDNYVGWELLTDDVSRGIIIGSEKVNFKGGSNVDLTYSATNNTIQIDATVPAGTGDGVVNGADLDIATGILSLHRSEGLADVTEDLDGRWSLLSHNHTGVYLPITTQLPITKSAISGQFLNSYNSVTGFFTSAIANYFEPSTLSADYGYIEPTHVGTFAPVLTADENYVTDAEKIVLGNTSGTNTGDQDLSGYLLNTTDTLTGDLTVTGIVKNNLTRMSANWQLQSSSQIPIFYVNDSTRMVGYGGQTNPLNVMDVFGNGLFSGTLNASNLSGTNTGDQTLTSLGAEASLGNPTTNGYILSSTTGGVRSWIAPPTGGTPGGISGNIQYNNGGVFAGFGTVNTYTIDFGKPILLEPSSSHPNAFGQGCMTYDSIGRPTVIINSSGHGNRIPFDGQVTNQLNGTGTKSVSWTLDWRYGACADITISANHTVTISNLPDGAIGTLIVQQDAGGTNTLAVSSSGLTMVIMGNNSNLNLTGSGYSTVTYKRLGSKIIVIYGHEN